jgi:hypothetical protein
LGQKRHFFGENILKKKTFSDFMNQFRKRALTHKSLSASNKSFNHLIFVPIGGCRPTVSLLNDFKTD